MGTILSLSVVVPAGYYSAIRGAQLGGKVAIVENLNLVEHV